MTIVFIIPSIFFIYDLDFVLVGSAAGTNDLKILSGSNNAILKQQ